MNIEGDRYRTYERAPLLLKKKGLELAREGFYWTGTGDTVRCFSCGKSLNRWTMQDNVAWEHYKWMEPGQYCVHHFTLHPNFMTSGQPQPYQPY
jgi:hypothetical protein